MLAFSLNQPQNEPPQGGDIGLKNSEEVALSPSDSLDLARIEGFKKSSSEEYAQLQRRIFLATVIIAFFGALVTAIFFDLNFSISLLIGAFSGILYMRLLARNIGNLGESSRNVGKVQLVVPVLLVLAVSKLPQLELLPAILGFLLYKPSMLLQAVLKS